MKLFLFSENKILQLYVGSQKIISLVGVHI